MRRTILLCLFLIAIQAAAPAEEKVSRFKFTGQPDLRVHTDDGSVSIRSWDSPEIEARVITRGWKISPSEVRVEERQNGDRVELDVHVPNLHFSWGDRSVQVELRVPKNLNTEVHTGDGSITMDGVKGKARLVTGDGKIELTGFDGSLEANTGDGSMRIRGRLDALDLRTGDGGIEADAERGSRMQGSWHARTGDGHITLRLPQNFAADVDAHTGDGHIEIDFPIMVSGMQKENEIRGKLNGGGESLILRTNDGGIRVEALR